jgi:hypothetical protein
MEDSMQTPEASLEALTNRVAKLESQNRNLKKAGIASIIAATVVIAMGQAPTKKVVEANEFVLQDASGKTRARLSMEGNERPALSFYKDKTNITASLAGGDEPFLVLFRPGTTEEVTLGANRTFFGLGLYEKEIRAGLSVQEGVPGLELYNEDGKPQVGLELPSVGPSFTLTGPNFKASLNMGVFRSPVGPNFTMFGQNKEVLWSAP